jgi:hypothetical protein
MGALAEEHNELAGLHLEVLETIANLARVVAGRRGECLALRELDAGKWLVAVYRETEQDGFVITAFVTRRLRSLASRRQIWP